MTRCMDQISWRALGNWNPSTESGLRYLVRKDICSSLIQLIFEGWGRVKDSPSICARTPGDSMLSRPLGGLFPAFDPTVSSNQTTNWKAWI